VPRSLALAAAAFLLLAPSSARAGVPGTWTRVTFPTGANIDQVSLARAPDGVLHVAFLAKNAGDTTKQDIFHAAITAAGGVGVPDPVQEGWATVDNPSIILDGGGLRTFFGGIRTTDPGETNSNLSTATAGLGGSPWTLTTGTVVTGDAAYGSPSAATVAGGVPWQAWAGTAGVFVHRGLDPATPNANLQSQLNGCCGYDPGIVTEPSAGAPVVAWASNATGKSGVWAQALDAATGSPTGAAVQMPGSTTGGEFSQQLARTPIAVRPGRPGAFIAYPGNYPTTNRVLLWQVGSPSSAIVAEGAAYRNVTLAGGPDGRLWVLWEQRTASGAPLVLARRSNPTVTAFGQVVSVAPPPKANDAWKLDADAQTGRVDVLGSFSTPDGLATWHTQVLPGLTLVASKARALSGGRVSIKVRVLDAGSPVAGAKVGSATTGADGRATITLKKGKRRSLKLAASRAGFASNAVKVRLR
jgi:hypothetical protein